MFGAGIADSTVKRFLLKSDHRINSHPLHIDAGQLTYAFCPSLGEMYPFYTPDWFGRASVLKGTDCC